MAPRFVRTGPKATRVAQFAVLTALAGRLGYVLWEQQFPLDSQLNQIL
jgi:hypothetical protein